MIDLSRREEGGRGRGPFEKKRERSVLPPFQSHTNKHNTIKEVWRKQNCEERRGPLSLLRASEGTNEFVQRE